MEGLQLGISGSLEVPCGLQPRLPWSLERGAWSHHVSGRGASVRPVPSRPMPVECCSALELGRQDGIRPHPQKVDAL